VVNQHIHKIKICDHLMLCLTLIKKREKAIEKIDLEAHFYTKEYVKTLLDSREFPRFEENKQIGTRRLWYSSDVSQPFGDTRLNKLLDLDKERLKDMKTIGVTMQVLSLSAPGLEQFKGSTGKILSKKINDELSKTVEKYPDKFIGFAALAPQNPGEAADELERAVKELGLKGWLTHSNIGGTYLDDPKYWVLLDKAERLDVPVYLHPTVSAISELRTYGFALAGPLLGFGLETAMCMMRLILSGVFDRYPKLTFILGHLGETIPFLLNRIDFGYTMAESEIKIKLVKKPSTYFRDNVFICTSGDFEKPVYMCTHQITGADKMLFATDYPYEDLKESGQRIEALPLSKDHREKIYCLNAQKLLHLS